MTDHDPIGGCSLITIHHSVSTINLPIAKAFYYESIQYEAKKTYGRAIYI